jgi:hypothetical protein
MLHIISLSLTHKTTRHKCVFTNTNEVQWKQRLLQTTRYTRCLLWCWNNTTRHATNKMNLIEWLTRQTTGITNGPCKKKYHVLKSDESNSHPSPWLLQLVLKWTLWESGIFTNPQIFCYSDWSTRSCVDEPIAIASFLLWWYKWNTLSSSSTLCSTNLVYCTTPHVTHIEPWQSFQFCTDFNHLRVVLIVHYKFMHLIIQFNPSATQLLLYTSILSLRFNFLKDKQKWYHLAVHLFHTSVQNI